MSSRNGEPGARTILMVTIGYPPRQVGGTEIYVEGLIEQLQADGYQCHVAYLQPVDDAAGPAVSVEKRWHNGTTVHMVRADRARAVLSEYDSEPAVRELLLDAFETIVSAVRPDLVHVHPLVLGFDSYLVERLKRRGLPVVLTFHSSTTGCLRGDLVYMGEKTCDGRIVAARCAACYCHKKGVPRPMSMALAWCPRPLLRAVAAVAGRLPGGSKLRTLIQMPLLARGLRQAWDRAMSGADVVVAVCHWVRDVTLRNGVPQEKVVLSRHGLRLVSAAGSGAPHSGDVRYGYVGRLGLEKGIDVLLEALAGIPRDVRFTFDFCSASFAAPNPDAVVQNLCARIRQAAAADDRLRVLGAVPTEKLGGVLEQWDALIVPSVWFESGPQVVYESFAVKTPVIGSDRGGIAELVTSGTTGLLVPPKDVAALRSALMRFARDPAELRRWRANIGPVRTTRDLGDDMKNLYDRLLSSTTDVMVSR
jgi:glycosyltransferase involved in cell wall biosynthesis